MEPRPNESRRTTLKVYANLLSKIGRSVEQRQCRARLGGRGYLSQPRIGAEDLRPYRCPLESDQLVRVYLDELPPAPPDQFEMGILELIAAEPETALKKA